MSRFKPLLPRHVFARKLIKNFCISMGLILLSLFVGMWGYHFFESMTWIDSFANASMILSGMGPLTALQTWGGKMFAGIYALYSGLALILASGILFGPLVHRALHRFHLQDEN